MAIDTIKATAILDGAVDTADLADDAVTTAKIADDAVGSAAIADDAIVSAAIADDSVTTAKINADAITQAKIADNAVQKEHLISTTQGAGIMMYEHIETRVCKSNGDSNFGSGTEIKIDLSSVKHLYGSYKIIYHIGWTGTTNDINLVFDTLQGDGSTKTGTATWYGGNVRHTSSSGNGAGTTRNGATTAKFLNNIWATGSSNSIGKGGVQGEIDCYGFHWEVTGNIDGHDMAEVNADYSSDTYRTYYRQNAASYDDNAGLYTGEQGIFRQNKDFVSESTSGATSWGGFVLMSSSTVTFAQGSFFSIYGLRHPTAN